MKNTEEKISSGNYFCSHVFSDDVFHIIFDNVLLKVKILSRFLDILSNLLYPTPPNKRSLASSSWHFPILLLYFDHRLMKVLLIISGGKYVPRVFVWRPGPGCSKHG